MNPAKFATYLAAVVSPTVVGLLVDKLGIDEIAATETFFKSDVYAALSDEGTKMWHYSPELITSLVEEELLKGRFTYPQEAL